MMSYAQKACCWIWMEANERTTGCLEGVCKELGSAERAAEVASEVVEQCFDVAW